MQEKDIYTLEELYDNLRISLSKLGKMADINEGTLIRIRKGQYSVRKTTINKLLDAFSEIYGIDFSTKKVTGFTLEDKKAHSSQSEESHSDGIPTDLPPGTVKAVDFVNKYKLPDSSFSRWVKEGLKGERIETETRQKASGMGVQHYLTPSQQEQALEILKRHGKVKTPEVEQTDEPMWYAPGQEG
jgi:hypothetical protein